MEEAVAKKINNLFKSFQKIGEDYKSKIGQGLTLLDQSSIEIFKTSIPAELKRIFPDTIYKIKASLGQGRITMCPWIAIMNRQETTTTQQGVYLVFLLSKDLKRVYLQLAQGVTQTDYNNLITMREKIRSTLNLQNEYLLLFNDQEIDNENYKASSIYANEWNCDDDSYCAKLLVEFKSVYEEYIKAKDIITESATVMENSDVGNQPSDNDKQESKANNSGILVSLLAKYREELPSFWEYEKYKWEAVTHFQKHWDLEADDFSEMLTEATSKHVNLLDVKMYFPIGVLRDYVEFDKERTREMFRVLFDESQELSERISYFSNEAEAIRKLGGDRWKNHYQNLHAISVYLTFMYPNKYFIYKYTELHNTIERLGDNFTFPGQKTPPSFYSKVIDYCEGLRVRIAANQAVCNELDKLIRSSPDCYEDKHRNIATVDFIYYVGKRLKDIPSAGTANEDDDTFIEPDENSRHWIYAPGEGASMWQLCQDEGIMVLGWGKIGDYRQYESHEQLISDMQDAFNKHDKNFMHSSLAVWQFLHDMKVGDVIYVKKGLGKIIGRGVVQGDYEYDEELNERFRNKRRVHWTHVGEWDSPVGLPRKTLTRFYENSSSIFMLERLFFPDLKPAIEQIPFSIDKVIKDIDETGLIYTPALIKRFAFSLMTKPFVILSGLAGSGKTQLAITFAKALVEDTDTQLCAVSVGADWTNREPLLGFPNALQTNQYVRPESRVLDLMIEANMPENANKPYFLILDEMNMSYVERYFADFLSAMESKEAIPLWNGCLDPDTDDDSDDTPTSIKLPSNLFIIGTINVDETTYMFSPKVLDRANVIEFKISADEMSSFLENMKDVNPDNIISKAANMAASFVEIASKNDLKKEPAVVETLKKFFGELKNVNAEFGYRSATEIFRFICQAKNNDDTATKITDNEILDAAIVQKLLPKLHGSRKKLDPVLKQLWRLCFDGADSDSQIAYENATKAKFKESADKIWRMYESAIANGFTSFAEA